MKQGKSKEVKKIEVIRHVLGLLDARDKIIISCATFFFSFLSLLDLTGILLIGLVVTIATQDIIGNPIPLSVLNFLEFMGLSNLEVDIIVAIFATASASLLVLKTVLNIIFTKRFGFFLANREAKISTLLLENLFKKELDKIRSKTLSEYQHALTLGSSQAITTMIGSTIALLSELTLQILLAVTLVYYSPVLFLITTIYFSLIAIIVSKFLGRESQKISFLQAKVHTDSSAIIYNMVGGFREIHSAGKMHYFVSQFRDAKFLNAKLATQHAMLGQYSKYIFEIASVIALLIFSAFSFFTLTAIEAASSLAIFVAASSRIAPSILRVQLILIQLRGALGASRVFLDMCNEFLVSSKILGDSTLAVSQDKLHEFSGKGKRLIEISDVYFKYILGKRKVINGVSFEILRNKQYAIVGSSGAGKSTLVDLILGILEPQRGRITINGQPPNEFILNFPGQIQYVPQDIHLFGSSYAENVALGVPMENINIKQVERCLRAVGLFEEIRGKEDGIWGTLSDRGTNLSGGQRQRLGIARALYTNPEVLILDEATSALDSISENQIISIIEKLKSDLTLIVIAHRLSTISHSDHIMYIEKGRISASGTFEEVKSKVKVFKKQAKLMRL